MRSGGESGDGRLWPQGLLALLPDRQFAKLLAREREKEQFRKSCFPGESFRFVERQLEHARLLGLEGGEIAFKPGPRGGDRMKGPGPGGGGHVVCCLLYTSPSPRDS